VPFSRKRLFHALALPFLAREAGSAMTEPERVCPQSIASASGPGRNPRAPSSAAFGYGPSRKMKSYSSPPLRDLSSMFPVASL
jgi:hypothetical protein